MVEINLSEDTEFRGDATKIVKEISKDTYKELIVLRSTKTVFICGDFEDKPDGSKGPTSAMIELHGKFKSENIGSFMLNHYKTPLDHTSKEKIALKSADVVILINGTGAGTIGETTLSIDGILGMKTLFLYKNGDIPEEMLLSETEYTTHFPIKYEYKDDSEMVRKAFNVGKQILNCICRKELKGGDDHG